MARGAIRGRSPDRPRWRPRRGPRSPAGHAWTTAQDAELRDAAEAGIDLAELVEHFELPEEVIQARLTQLGLEIGEPTFGFD
jgi:hypothetical protein